MSKIVSLSALHALLSSKAIGLRETGLKGEAESNSTKSDYVTIKSMLPGFQCASEYYFEGAKDVDRFVLDDLVKDAHSWCNSDLVPEDKRVPSFLRGLFWMKDLKLDDVAFCPSLGEWDAKARSLKLAVWTHFVYRKGKGVDVPLMAQAAAKLPLIYTITFIDDTFTKANIWTNKMWANALIRFPLDELNKTEDGQCVRKEQGDVWNRPSFFFKFYEPKGTRYYAVRVMYDNGTVRQDVYDHMKKAEERDDGSTFVRYDTQCNKHGKHVNSVGTVLRPSDA